ncbi:MAG: hypothetical protein IPK10_13950 [Bacteroidetes bacterium]|nr:hypothetical protein [Bacteroidota bacterium]
MKKTLTLLLAITIGGIANAQTGTAINDNGASPDPSAILDVQSSSKGFLIPKMTLSERNAIVNPSDGLLIYQTDGLKGIYNYDNANGGAWFKSSSKWSDQPSIPGSIFYKPQNVAFPKIGIGLESPITYLDVAGSARIGANEFGVSANNPPINGLIVGGPVGIGTDVATPAMLTIGGVGGVAAMGVGNGHYYLAKNISGQYETWMVPRSNPTSQTLMYFDLEE